MDIGEEAVALRSRGFNCAQGVLAACREYTGLDDKTALAITAGFGGGMRCGELCGALSGAVMALGMANPHTEGGDLEAKARIAELTRACVGRFREDFGCLRCRELKEKGISCPALIAYSARLAEKIITEEKDNGDL